MRFLAAVFLILWLTPALAQSTVQPVPMPCAINATPGSGNNYSTSSLGASSTTLIPAPPQGVQRTAIWIQLLTSGATVGLNPSGAAASTSAAGNMVLSTQYQYLSFNSLGFMPSGAVTAIADSSSRVVTAYACPQ